MNNFLISKTGLRRYLRCHRRRPGPSNRKASLGPTRARHHGRHLRRHPAAVEGHQRDDQQHLHSEGNQHQRAQRRAGVGVHPEQRQVCL